MKTAAAERLEQRREEILERAILLFAREGYAEADLQILADELGVGKGTLYRHFGSKAKLFLAAADRVMRNLVDYVHSSLEGVADPLDQVPQGIRAYLEYFHEHPEAVEMLIQERAHFRDRKKATYFEHREANAERWRKFYRDLIACGRVRAIPVENIRDLVHDLLYGTMFVSYMAGRKQSPARLADNLVDIVFHGILSDTERQGRARASRRAHA